MSATQKEIAKWFDEGVMGKRRYMLIMCDTFDYSDYPVYFDAEAAAREAIRSPGRMTRFMEAYDLHADKMAQLNERRANCFSGEPQP